MCCTQPRRPALPCQLGDRFRRGDGDQFLMLLMKSGWLAMVDKGPWSEVLSRRLVQGCPSVVRSCREAAHACSTWGSSPVDSRSVHLVIACILPARGVTSSSRGIGTSDMRLFVGRYPTRERLIPSSDNRRFMPMKAVHVTSQQTMPGTRNGY